MKTCGYLRAMVPSLSTSNCNPEPVTENKQQNLNLLNEQFSPPFFLNGTVIWGQNYTCIIYQSFISWINYFPNWQLSSFLWYVNFLYLVIDDEIEDF